MAERKTRTKDERVAEIESKIAHHKECIKTLEKKKEAILNPKKRTRKVTSMKTILTKAKEQGLTTEQVIEKLGIKLD